MRYLFVLTALLFVLPAHAVEIEWVTVGDRGNLGDTDPYNDKCGLSRNQPCGAVPYTYLITKYLVTNTQYTEFLNAVAKTDTYLLYNTSMGETFSPIGGGITRSGGPGDYAYSAVEGREDWPVNYVSFWDALRFANWLHNGQASGAQDSSTTEDGAYTLDGYAGYDGSWISRNADATVFLTSEDEWYKAAYFNGTRYFDYPAGSDAPTTCAPPGPTPNTANCRFVVGYLTEVGSYTGSASPCGTFDQGGNIGEWIEDLESRSYRVFRGGNYARSERDFAASRRFPDTPVNEEPARGFRIAMIPEPTTALEIDIKPGSDPNSINSFSHGVIPVAILTTEEFDALTVDADSVLFGAAEAEKAHKQAHVEDVDYDGDLDLLFHFRTQDTGIALGDTEACLTGQTYDGVPVEGWDSVRTVPPDRPGVSTAVGFARSSTACGIGAELALVLPPMMWLWRRRRV
jgi:sulfatase modifying factor 1